MANATNVLSSGIEITGSIRFSNDMIIDGKIEGEIISEKGRVTIGENAAIKGNVTAGDVKVFGKVEGKITSERCELKAKSRLDGDIKAKMFSMEEGAQLSGRTETLTIHVEERFLAFDLTGAYTASLVLAALALLTLFVMQRLQPREGH